ncbi:molybdate ABC transporter substrate-binding protein [Dyella terrae]|uniref:molybdate ABC transporter substrate-binding protein n=1 Tax=Dyella terrae TaxID=522259 RepID=UPI001EFD9D0E|nr:molybdate ABC transporter substrate-binding protein [Dyella terrae]ULU24364.1 molybdate ABC transporter substrate-binding protein [Dyella terrae]
MMMRRLLQGLLAMGAVFASASMAASADNHITVAAAADLHQALDDVVAAYRHDHPDSRIDVVYGSSGNLLTQIEQGAPFEIFFSADSNYPQQLVEHGKSGSTPVPYAFGHLVMWSASIDMRGVQVADLAQPRFGRIAIANPQHAPYGKRAEQALRAAGVWDKVQSRLVFGDNIAQTAQFAQSGNAQVGLVAESLVINAPVKGTSEPVPASLYEPLKQSFVLTKHGADSPLARDFASYVQGAPAKAILSRYGFNLPEDGAH